MNSYQKRKQELAYYKERCNRLERLLTDHLDEEQIIYLSPRKRAKLQREINIRRSRGLTMLIKQGRTK